METKTSILEKIEQYVFEEDEIVTYKWLSRKHNIHVNVSKRFLSEFVAKTKENIGVCYMIGGVKCDGSHSVLVGWQNDISIVKNEFKTVTSEHVYSVQKSAASVDLKVHLYSADNPNEIKDQVNSYSAIKFDGNILRNTCALEELKKKALLAANVKSAEVTKKSTTNGTKQSDLSEKENGSKPSVANAGPPSKGIKKTESSSPKKGGIAAMFAAQKDTKKTENKAKVGQTNQSKPKGLNAFFNKSNDINNVDKDKINGNKAKLSSPDDRDGKKGNDAPVAKQEIKESPEETKVDNCVKSQSTTTKNSKAKTTTKKGGKKRKKSSSGAGAERKRKRILTISDSESSEEEEGYRSASPEERQATPPPPVSDDDDEVIPETPQVGKRAKKKKLVEKTFLDDDGFLVTNKEYKLLSDSEEEVGQVKEDSGKPSEGEKVMKETKVEAKEAKLDVVETKGKVKEGKKKISPQNVKQASIMNFFKRS